MTTPAPLPTVAELERELNEMKLMQPGRYSAYIERCRQLLSLLPLLPYVQHKPGCGTRKVRTFIGPGVQYGSCTCGLDTLKAAIGI